MVARSSITYESRRRKRKPIVVVGGDKGGVGKSVVARVLAAWLRKNGNLVMGFDGDARNAHLDRYYGDCMEVRRTYLRRERGWAELFTGWEEAHASAVILIDLPGNIGDVVEREVVRIQRIAEALDRSLVHVWVADEEEDSVTLLARVSHLALAPHTLVILNGRFVPHPTEFELWLESEVREQLMAMGASETFVPALPIRARTRIARARSSFDDLSAAELTIWERCDFDMWWEKVESALVPFASIMERAS